MLVKFRVVIRKQVELRTFILQEWWRTRVLFRVAGISYDWGVKLIRFSQKYRKSAIILTDVDYESRYAPTSNESRYTR